MRTCPAGHQSIAADYCDICGMRMTPAAAPSTATEYGRPALGALPDPPAAPCPECGTPGLVRYCEKCGFAVGTETAAEPADPPVTGGADIPMLRGSQPEVWTAVVTVSRRHYDTVMAAAGPDASALRFPDDRPVRRFPLTGNQMRIGRRSLSKEVMPEIDLTGPLADPGISRLHAILRPAPEGSWVLIDPGSENGTWVNGSEILPGQPVSLGDGDTICIGAWTAIRIVKSP